MKLAIVWVFVVAFIVTAFIHNESARIVVFIVAGIGPPLAILCPWIFE